MCDYVIRYSHGYRQVESRTCGSNPQHDLGDMQVCGTHFDILARAVVDGVGSAGKYTESERCRATKADGLRCGNQAMQTPFGLDLCGRHMQKAEIWAQAFVSEQWQLRAQRHAEEARVKEAHRRTTSIVYYVQGTDDLIKIGFTENFRKRWPALKKEYEQRHGSLTLIGWHRGSREAETAMHRRFADDRVEGEWFLASDELLAHVAQIRERHPVWAEDLLHHMPTPPCPPRARATAAA